MWLHTTEMDISKCHQGNKGGRSSRPLNHDKARALQSVHRGATIEKEVLAVHLDEPQFWRGLEDLAVMPLTKADADGSR